MWYRFPPVLHQLNTPNKIRDPLPIHLPIPLELLWPNFGNHNQSLVCVFIWLNAVLGVNVTKIQKETGDSFDLTLQTPFLYRSNSTVQEHCVKNMWQNSSCNFSCYLSPTFQLSLISNLSSRNIIMWLTGFYDKGKNVETANVWE